MRAMRSNGSAASNRSALRLRSDSVFSFVVSEDTVESCRGQRLLSAVAQMEMAVQTEPRAWRTCGVNTLASWQEGGIVCATCSKPPPLPGEQPRHSSQAKRSTRRASSRPQTRREMQPLVSVAVDDPEPAAAGLPPSGEFDGSWVVFHESQEAISPWLRSLDIFGKRALDAMGRECQLTTQSSPEAPARTFLEGGLLSLTDGVLYRAGRSGQTLAFVQREQASFCRVDCEWEENAADAPSRSASFCGSGRAEAGGARGRRPAELSSLNGGAGD